MSASSSTVLTSRDIIAVDETLCNGCGLCLPSCAEGALILENGKVRVLADKLCDGLGACLGACPRGALRITRREAAPFDEHAAHATAPSMPSPAAAPAHGGPSADSPSGRPAHAPQEHTWPLKLQLTPLDKPFLREARLVLAADCAPAACHHFAARYLPGKAMLLTCPKLEDKAAIVARLTELFRVNPPRDITVIRMEVPCCCLPDLVQKAQEAAGTSIPARVSILTRSGQENLPGLGRSRP